jgi:hypothetical protein
MQEVLEEHHFSHADWDERQFAVICHCGMDIAGEDDGEEAYLQEEALYAGHLADSLTAAGFGPVKAAQELAWAKGATSAGMNLMALQSAGINPNPYRAIEADQ